MKVFDIALNEVVDCGDIELILNKNVNKYECICGAILNKKSKLRHEKSKRHIIYLDKVKKELESENNTPIVGVDIV